MTKKTDSPPPPSELARWRSSPSTTQKQKFHPLPSSTPITPGHHMLVLPQKCNCSDPVSHWPSTGSHMMWSQRNTPTVLCGKHSAVWCIYRISLLKWVDVSMGTTCTSARVPEKQVFVASPSVMGRRVLSSEKLFIELLCFHALVILTSTACHKSS
jgi:hypothetical protein